jgi:hypothetical protein
MVVQKWDNNGVLIFRRNTPNSLSPADHRSPVSSPWVDEVPACEMVRLHRTRSEQSAREGVRADSVFRVDVPRRSRFVELRRRIPPAQRFHRTSHGPPDRLLPISCRFSRMAPDGFLGPIKGPRSTLRPSVIQQSGRVRDLDGYQEQPIPADPLTGYRQAPWAVGHTPADHRGAAFDIDDATGRRIEKDQPPFRVQEQQRILQSVKNRHKSCWHWYPWHPDSLFFKRRGAAAR